MGLQISPDGTRPHCPLVICSFYEMDQLQGWGTQAPARTLSWTPQGGGRGERVWLCLLCLPVLAQPLFPGPLPGKAGALPRAAQFQQGPGAQQ